MAKTIKDFTNVISSKLENRKQMKLVNGIDKLKWRYDMAKEMLDIKKEEFDTLRNKKVHELKNSFAKKLYDLELKISPVDKVYKELLSKVEPSFDKKQRLAFRAYRQTLRRNDKIVDKDGKILPDGKLSSNSESLLADFVKNQEAEKEAFKNSIRVKAESITLSGEELENAKVEYEARLEEQRLKVEALDKSLEEENAKKYQEYKAKTEANMAKWQNEAEALQNKLNAEMELSHLELPDDVVLRLENLTMQFGGLKAVNDLSFDVKQGEIFGLIGPNGAGKTTVFNCITQFYKPTAGQVYYRTKENKVINLNSYVVHDVIKTGIVRTFQNVEVIKELTILQNLLIAAHTQYKSNIFQQFFNTRSVKQEEAVIFRRALKVLEYCDLMELKDIPPVGLPYGILKRIELARTLMANANLIILDEPAAGLNDQETKELAERIKKIRRDFNVTIFLVEHDMGLVMDICEHICAISFGKKLAYGTPQEIQKDPYVQEAYLGTNEKE